MRIVQPQNEPSSTGFASARKIHPEDICIGDDVAMSEVSYQYLSSMWCAVDATRLPPEEPVRVTFLPFGDMELLAVQSICLPFVLCETINGGHRVLDVRQVQLAKLDPAFARLVRKATRKKRSKKKRGKKDRKTKGGKQK